MPTAYPTDLYDAVHVGTPGDVAFYRGVCTGAASVLELGCGSGRVLAALDEPGRALFGLDTSQEALAIAAARVPAARLLHGAMQDLDLDERFDRVIAPFSALYCLESAEALTRTLRAAVRHLAPGGLFVADVWNAEAFHAEGNPEDDELSPLIQIDARGATYHVYERSEWDRDRQRLLAIYEYRPVRGTAAPRSTKSPRGARNRADNPPAPGDAAREDRLDTKFSPGAETPSPRGRAAADPRAERARAAADPRAERARAAADPRAERARAAADPRAERARARSTGSARPGTGANGAPLVATIAHRYFLRAELERALRDSGAPAWELEADFRGTPWNAASELTVIRLRT